MDTDERRSVATNCTNFHEKELLRDFMDMHRSLLHCVCNQYSGASFFNNRVHFYTKCKILFFPDCGSTVNLQAYQQTGSFQDKSERVMSP
jgi:hypothetical protein